MGDISRQWEEYFVIFVYLLKSTLFVNLTSERMSSVHNA